MRQPKHSIVHFNQLWARKTIPVDLRQVMGKNQFLERVCPWPSEYTQANALVSVLIADWTHQIMAARLPLGTVTRAPFPPVEPIRPARRSAVDLIMTGQIYRKEAEVLRGAEKLLTKKKISVAFMDHFAEWQKRTHHKGHTLDQAVAVIKKFSDQVPSPTGRGVQVWIEDQLKTASAGTVRRKLTILRSYWSWLESHEYVARDQSPFDHRKVIDPRTSVEKTLEKRQTFSKEDVLRLIAAAQNDMPLQALIRIAAHSGARREGIASLKTGSVITKDGVRCFDLREKTAAGVRQVPIHSEISGLVDQLIAESKDGFLIPSIAGRHGDRGNALGKRFTPLKRSLGFGENHVFHSFRHSVVHLFRSVGCPLEIRNQILGHEGGDEVMGAGGGYGGHIDMKLKLEWLERAIKY